MTVRQHGNCLAASKPVCLQQHPGAVLVRVCRPGGTGTGSPLTNGAYGGFGGEHKLALLDTVHALVLGLTDLMCCHWLNSMWHCQAGAARERLQGKSRPMQQPRASAVEGEVAIGDMPLISSILSEVRLGPQPKPCTSRSPHPTWCAGASYSVRGHMSCRNHWGVAPVRSGGHGGGTPNSNTTAVCGSTSSTICSTPAASVPSAGGTSFASGIVSSAAFQLGPPVVGPFPPGGGTVLPQNGYVQVARVS